MSRPDHDDPLRAAHTEIERLRAENRRLREWLDLAQEFGRLGVWERNPHTLEGHWDQHVFRFFGFEPGQTPSFSEASRRVVPEDRLDDSFYASLRAPGAHSHRYRIQRPDGSIAHMHSQWRVITDAQGRAERVIGVLMDDTEARTRAHEAEARHAQLELALDMAAVGLWRLDLATQHIHYDKRGQDLLGRPMGPEGIPLDEVRAWIHPEDLPAVRAAMEATLAHGGPYDTQTRYRHADGRWRTMLTRRVLQRDARGKPLAVLGVGLDVTEQLTQINDALALARRLEGAAEAARVGLWSGPLDGRAPEWNARMYQLLERDPELGPLTMGESLRQYTHADDRDRVAATTLAWLRAHEDQALDMEMRVVRGDGELRWFEVRAARETDPDGQPRAFGVMLDITEQRQALDRLREANGRLTLALDAVGMGTWMHDALAGTDHWDERMFTLRGLAPSAQVPDRAARMALVLPEDRESADTQSMPFLTSARALNYEFRIRRADDGQVRTLASRSVALTDAQGRVVRRIGVNWDVTEAREAERAWRERELALRESRVKSALFARISHELRTPLNAVLGFTQLLQADDARLDTTTRQRRLLEIQRAGEHLLGVVDGALDLSAPDDAPVDAQAVALTTAVERALAGLTRHAAARDVHVERGPLAATVRADTRRLQEVLTQLLDNALRFSRPGGQVGIEARSEGAEVVIAISDSGPGIAAERVPRLFEPFEGANVGTGHGLGLAIAQAQARRMGGLITLAATGAQGSRFELRLPAAERAGQPTAGSARPLLLYIEDNEVNLLIVRELIAQRPHIEFHGAEDGESGVARALELRPALLLIDMQLPGIDGTEVLRRVRADAATARIPCIALSANAMPEDMRAARAAGFDDYWTKPIDLRAFLAAIDRLLPVPRSGGLSEPAAPPASALAGR